MGKLDDWDPPKPEEAPKANRHALHGELEAIRQGVGDEHYALASARTWAQMDRLRKRRPKWAKS